MTTIKLTCQGAAARVKVDGAITAGMVGIPVEIAVDESWDGLVRTLVCMSAGHRAVIPAVTDRAVVAWEVLTAGMRLYLGLEGRDSSGSIVIPTIWADCGVVQPGASGCHAEAAPTPSEIEQLLVCAGTAQERSLEAMQMAEAALTAGAGMPEAVETAQACASAALAAREEALDSAVRADAMAAAAVTAAEQAERDAQTASEAAQRAALDVQAAIQTTAGLTEARAALAEYRFDLENLKAAAAGHLYRTHTAELGTVPAGAMPYAALDRLGGTSGVRNQWIGDKELRANSSYFTRTESDGMFIYTANKNAGQSTGRDVASPLHITHPGHKYLLAAEVQFSQNGTVYWAGVPQAITAGTWLRLERIVTSVSETGYYPIAARFGFTVGFVVRVRNAVQIDLSQWLGAAAASVSTAAQAYALGVTTSMSGPDEGTVIHTAPGVTESRSADGRLLGRAEVPAGLASLPGWGWSVGEVRNEVDFEHRTYIRRIGCVDLGSLNWTASGGEYRASLPGAMGPGLCSHYAVVEEPGVHGVRIGNGTVSVYTGETGSRFDGVSLYYQMAEPIVTDISDLLTGDSSLPVVPGGNVSISAGGGTITYLIKLTGDNNG